jgi:hypothetical protein
MTGGRGCGGQIAGCGTSKEEQKKLKKRKPLRALTTGKTLIVIGVDDLANPLVAFTVYCSEDAAIANSLYI